MSAPAWVLGEGAVCALGLGAAALREGVFAGRSGLRPRERLAEVAGLPPEAPPAGEVPREVWEPARSLPLALGRLAASEALGDAPRAGLGLIVATAKGDLAGIDPLDPQAEGLGNPWRLATRLRAELAVDAAPLATVSCACASGLSALALAARWLARERVERVLVVGVDGLTPFVLRGFASLLALDPEPCRPFDAARRGLTLGEGAAALLLGRERPDGADPVALVGWGESNDANHITGPSRDGAGLRLAARRALARAGLAPADVDYVHLHGTGTRYNDASEALALAGLFGGATPPASGTKAQTGHTLGAAGLLESLVAIEALRRGVAPANVGLQESDVDPALTLPRAPTPLPRARAALKVAAGFAGIDAALVFERRGAAA